MPVLKRSELTQLNTLKCESSVKSAGNCVLAKWGATRTEARPAANNILPLNGTRIEPERHKRQVETLEDDEEQDCLSRDVYENKLVIATKDPPRWAKLQAQF